jgi:hypothetical protein
MFGFGVNLQLPVSLHITPFCGVSRETVDSRVQPTFWNYAIRFGLPQQSVVTIKIFDLADMR